MGTVSAARASSAPVVIANQYCHVLSLPLLDAHLVQMNRDVIHRFELFIPSHVYCLRPRGIMPDSQAEPDAALRYRQLINLFGHLAMATTNDKKMSNEDDPRARPMLMPSNNRVSVTFERVRHAITPEVIVGYRLRLTEHCPLGSNPGMCGELETLITSNMQVLGKRRTAPPTAARQQAQLDPASQLNVMRGDYRNLCSFYATKEHAAAMDATDNTHNMSLAQPGNPCCLTQVFTVARSLELANNLGADPSYCDAQRYLNSEPQRRARRPAAGAQSANYDAGDAGDDAPGREADADGRCGFADSRDVCMISVQDIDPLSLGTRLLPFISADLKQSDKACARYNELNGLRPDSKYYQSFCSTTSDPNYANDIGALSALVTSNMAELHAAHPSVHQSKPDSFFAALREKKKQWNQRMTEIINPEGDAAPAIRKLATFRDSYLLANNNCFSVPRQHTMANLSRFEDMLAQHAAVMKTIVTVKSAFKLSFVLLLSALHVFRRVDMHPHALLLGPPGIGKSFALMLLTKLLINGTWLMLSNMTPKALQVPGKVNDCLTMIFEDAPGSLLGASASNRNGNAVATDMEAMIKQFMTSMTASTLTLTMEPSRAGVQIVGDCSCVCLFAMNDDTSIFSAAVLSRANVFVTTEPDAAAADSGPNMTDMMARSSDPSVRSAMKEVCVYWHRTQVLMAEIMYRISAGVLHDVTMDVANTFYGLVSTHMRKTRNNRCMDLPRKFLRWRATVLVLLVLDVIDLYWDSPLSVFAGVPHHNDHFLVIEKGLTVLMRHCIFAFGLHSTQIQDDMRVNVMATLIKLYVPDMAARVLLADSDAIGDEDEEEPSPPALPFGYLPPALGPPSARQLEEAKQPDMQRYLAKKSAYDGMRDERQNWNYVTIPFGTALLPSVTGWARSTPSANELIMHVASQLMSRIPNKPLHGQVVATLHALANETVLESRTLMTASGSTRVQNKTCNALVIDATRMRVSFSVLRRASEDDVLYSVVSEVTQALFNRGGIAGNGPNSKSITFLYGDTEPADPHVWRRVVAVRRPPTAAEAAISTTVVNVDHFEAPLREQTRNFLAPLRASRDSPDAMTELFKSSAPFTVVDCDLDTQAVNARMHALGLCQEDQIEQPSSDTQETERQLYQIFQERSQRLGLKRMHYPECYRNRDPQRWRQYWEQQRRDQPDLFSLRARDELLRAQTQARPRRKDDLSGSTSRQRALDAARNLHIVDAGNNNDNDNDDHEMDAELAHLDLDVDVDVD